jgi:hypothetical protein
MCDQIVAFIAVRDIVMWNYKLLFLHTIYL